MGVESLADVLFGEIDVRMEHVEETGNALVVTAVARGPPPRCPNCRSRGARVHSSYERSIADLPLGGRLLVVRLRVRRFFCDRSGCWRRTFVEQVERLSERYRRSSTALVRWQRAVAVELGGRPAERLCRMLGLAGGRTRLLGLLTEPATAARVPRVLGVDEFAFRRGMKFGTLLVDVEQGGVVDVLPDRGSATFAAWLTAHPGTEIICRDRATAYSKAVKQPAPQAVEVADLRAELQRAQAGARRQCTLGMVCFGQEFGGQLEANPVSPVLTLHS